MNTLSDNTNVYLVVCDSPLEMNNGETWRQECKRFIVTVAWTKGGTAMAYYNWKEKADGRAGGGGYDKESAAVCDLFERLFNIELDASGAGMSTVKTHALNHGIQILSLSDALEKIEV